MIESAKWTGFPQPAYRDDEITPFEMQRGSGLIDMYGYMDVLRTHVQNVRVCMPWMLPCNQ